MYSDLPDDLPHILPQNIGLPYRDNVKIWNDTAKECYYLKCSCENCFIYKTYFFNTPEKCKMKYYVYYFLKKLGAPENNLA